jgi:hypothetical protein
VRGIIHRISEIRISVCGIAAALANKFEDLLHGLEWDRWQYNGLLKHMSSITFAGYLEKSVTTFHPTFFHTTNG